MFIHIELEHASIRKEIKHRIKKNTSQDDLIVFRFSTDESNQLTWMKSNEFKYKGQFYDVVNRLEIDANHVEYQCVSDEQETQLFAQLEDLVDKRYSNSGKEKSGTFIKVMSTPFLAHSSSFQIQFFETTEDKTQNNCKQWFALTSDRTPLENPPELYL